MMANNVAIRLGTTGKGEVKADFAEVKAAGTEAMKSIADGARLAGDSGERQLARLESNAKRLEQQMQSLDRQRARNDAKMAAIVPQTSLQMRIDDSVSTGFGRFEGSAKAAALAFAELIAKEEQLEARTRTLLTAIDPLWAAQQRYNAEVGEAKVLLDAGRISTEQYAQAQLRAKTALDSAAASARLNVTMTGEQRAGMQQLTMNMNDAVTMWAMGASAQQVFVSQAGQTIQAIQLMTGGASGFATFMSGPWGAAITVGVIALIPFVAKLFEGEDALKKVEFASNSLGDAQGVLGSVMDLTTGKINTQNEALHAMAKAQALVMQVQAQARAAEAARTIQEARDPQWQMGGGLGGGLYIGRQRGPAAGIVTRFQGGNLTGEQTVDELKSLQEQGKLTERQFMDLAAAVANYGLERENIKRAEALEKALDGDRGAAQQFLKVDKPDKPKVDRRAETLARESAATESLIENLRRLADAYFESDAAALKAEITARATEQGMKKRADVAAYVEQQLRLEVSRRTADLSKTVALMRQENTARQDLNTKVLEGRITAEDAQRMMRDEVQLRPFVIAHALAEGDAKAKLAARIAELRLEQKAANDEDKRGIAGRELAAIRDALELADEELRLVGATAEVRDRSLAMLQKQQQLQRAGVDLETSYGREVMTSYEGLLRKNEMIAQQADAWREAAQIGETFIDNVLDPGNWDDFGQVGKRVLGDLMNDMIRLVAINPLKNMLFGSGLPVIGDVIGAFGKMGGLGGVDYGALAQAAATIKPSGFASGTEYFGGGVAKVGEHGEENVFLPQGTRILNAAETRRMAAANSNGPVVNIDASIHAPGADGAALARVEAQQQALMRDLPGMIISTVNDATQRRVLRR